MQLPLRYPDSPEGKRLVQARRSFHEAMEQEKRLVEEERAQVRGLHVHLRSENLARVMKEYSDAGRAYYMATEDESQLVCPILPREQWKPFRCSVEKYFGKIARDFSSTLEKILPWIYGFATRYTIVIVRVDYDVRDDRSSERSLLVTLRPRKPGEKIDISDEVNDGDVGLTNIVSYQNPNAWNLNPTGVSDEDVKNHAEKLLEFCQSFLDDPNADWGGLRKWLRQKHEKWLAENPWIKKFCR